MSQQPTDQPISDARSNGRAVHLVVTILGFLLTISHRPDVVLNAQFWAEDGKVWYADAYNIGALAAMFKPEAGYFQTIARLVAAAAQLLPFADAPLFFNLCAIGVKLSVVNFIVSKRMARAIPDLWVRLLFSFIYLVMPHTFESTGNLTNAQWHLAFLAFLIVIATPAVTTAGLVFDICAVGLSAVSGPFCILLLPIAAIKFIATRERRLLTIIAILVSGAAIQIGSLLFVDRPSKQALGATPELFFKIVGGHIFVDALLGDRIYAKLIALGWWSGPTAAITCVAGFAIFAFGYLKARLELRLLMAFSCLIVTAALISPTISSTVPQWTAMWPERVGSRYWLIPMCCLFATLVLLARTARQKLVRMAFIGVLCLGIVGVVADWKHPRFADLDFQSHAADFDQAASGTEVSIPINPGWQMTLVKK